MLVTIIVCAVASGCPPHCPPVTPTTAPRPPCYSDVPIDGPGGLASGHPIVYDPPSPLTPVTVTPPETAPAVPDVHPVAIPAVRPPTVTVHRRRPHGDRGRYRHRHSWFGWAGWLRP